MPSGSLPVAAPAGASGKAPPLLEFGFFQFVHNTRRNGYAPLGVLIATLVA